MLDLNSLFVNTMIAPQLTTNGACVVEQSDLINARLLSELTAKNCLRRGLAKIWALIYAKRRMRQSQPLVAQFISMSNITLLKIERKYVWKIKNNFLTSPIYEIVIRMLNLRKFCKDGAFTQSEFKLKPIM